MTKQEIIDKYIHPKLKKYVRDIKYEVIGFTDCLVVDIDFGKIEKIEVIFELNTRRTFRNINNRINTARKLIIEPTERMIVLEALSKKTKGIEEK